MQGKQTGLPWPEIEYDNDTGSDDEGFWEWWEIPGVAKFNHQHDAIIAREAVNERPIIIARLATYEAALREIADSPGSEKLAVIARKALETK